MLLMCILVVKDSLGHIRVVWCRIQFFFTSHGLFIYYWRERERERERERSGSKGCLNRDNTSNVKIAKIGWLKDDI